VEPLDPPSVFDIEVQPPEEPIQPATFGGVIGMGPAPAPLWIGPSDGSDATLDETPVVELSPFEPAVNFRSPMAGMPGDPPDDGVLLHLMQRTLPTQPQDREFQEPPAPPRQVVPQTWPGYRYVVVAPYRPVASQPTLAPQRPPLRTRVYELMIWPWRTLTEPFRD
jgi:hypothetical protein